MIVRAKLIPHTSSSIDTMTLTIGLAPLPTIGTTNTLTLATTIPLLFKRRRPNILVYKSAYDIIVLSHAYQPCLPSLQAFMSASAPLSHSQRGIIIHHHRRCHSYLRIVVNQLMWSPLMLHLDYLSLFVFLSTPLHTMCSLINLLISYGTCLQCDIYVCCPLVRCCFT